MSPSNPTPTPRFLTLPQVSEQLACSNAQTYALVRSGDLAAIKIGGRGQWRIAQTDYLGFRPRPDRKAEVSTLMTRHQHTGLQALEEARR